MFSLIKKIRYWVRSVFSFSQKETTGFLTLTVIMVLLLFGWLLLEFFLPAPSSNYASDKAKLDSLITILEKGSKSNNPEDKSVASVNQTRVLTAFDPNQLNAEQWQKWGIPKYIADRIIKYKEKGGKFKVKGDLLKIYGFPEPMYSQLYSYILLPDSISYEKRYEKHENTVSKKTPASRNAFVKYEKKEIKLAHFNLNAADTTQLKLVNGIGPALSKRIIKYRDLLGGFVSTEQIREVYGLDSTVVDELLKFGYLPENASLRKININAATVEELDAHPYISPKVAKIIVAHRQQHGKFTSLESIYEIRVLDKLVLAKLAPYISFE